MKMSELENTRFKVFSFIAMGFQNHGDSNNFLSFFIFQPLEELVRTEPMTFFFSLFHFNEILFCETFYILSKNLFFSTSNLERRVYTNIYWVSVGFETLSTWVNVEELNQLKYT